MPSKSAATVDYSAFDQPEFVAESRGRSPSAQIINPRFTKSGIAPYGFAVTKDNAEAAGFTPPTGWELVDHSFSSGEKEVYMTLSPRLVVLARSPLYLRNRETGDFVGESSQVKDWWQSKHLYKIGSYAHVFILDEHNERCMAEPLLVSLNGASGASFNAAWLQMQTETKPRGGFCFDMENAYAQATNQPYQAKGSLFHAHCIYCPTFDAEERGTPPNTAMVAVVTGYQSATLQNLVLPGSEFSELIKISYESVKGWQPKALLKKAVESLDEDDDGYSGRPRQNLHSYVSDEEYPPY